MLDKWQSINTLLSILFLFCLFRKSSKGKEISLRPYLFTTVYRLSFFPDEQSRSIVDSGDQGSIIDTFPSEVTTEK